MSERLTREQFAKLQADPATRRSISVAEYKAMLEAEKSKPQKYGNTPTWVDSVNGDLFLNWVGRGERFASILEARRWCALNDFLRVGAISNLRRQTRFDLHVNGKKVATYVDDFDYIEDGSLVVEDTKGVLTPEFKMKAKMMLAEYGIRIRLVKAKATSIKFKRKPKPKRRKIAAPQ